MKVQMILTRELLATKERADEMRRALMGTHWPGGDGPEGYVPENGRFVCRSIEAASEQNGFVWLVATYEG